MAEQQIAQYEPTSRAVKRATLVQRQDGTLRLYVTLDNRGTIENYRYDRVTKAQWDSLISAESAGRWMNQFVREYGTHGTARKGTSARRAGRYGKV